MTPDVMITSCCIPVGRMPPLSAMSDTPVGCPSTVNRAGQEDDADHQEGDQSDDLDQRGPELLFVCQR